MEKIIDRLLLYFEKRIPDFYKTKVIRPTQVQMAVDVMDFLQPDNFKKFFMIEAPVGTGKSLGVLVPSLIEKSFDNRKRIIYATSTINLQGQLNREEAPLLKEIGLLKKHIIAKGKNHYYCHSEYLRQAKKLNKYKDNFFNFYKKGKTGQRDEFEEEYGEISSKIWNEVSLNSTKGECAKCIHNYQCPTYHHRSSFSSEFNDLIITNHDQLIRSVLNVLSDIPQSPIVPLNSGIVIIDEAHDFMENFMGQLEDSLSIHDLKRLAFYIPNQLRKQYRGIVEELGEVLKASAEEVRYSQGRYPLTEIHRILIKKIINLMDEAMVQSVGRTMKFVHKNVERTEETLIEKAYSILSDLLSEDYVSWISYEDYSFHSISLTFNEQFETLLYRLARFNKVIIMSGTLTGDNDFTKTIDRWRLNPSDVRTKRLLSPFSYKDQAIIYVPKHLVRFQQGNENSDYILDEAKHIKELVSITEGRSLILTTSKIMMDDLYLALEPFMKTNELNFLKQDNGSIEMLTKKFKNDETSVLIGSGSFFSGISVKGKALISVILTKLPFPVPDDPYLKLISKGHEENFFSEILYPHMMIKLNQATGRLIRDIEDYGIITMLDERVFDKDYSMDIIKHFESIGYRFVRSVKEVKQFLSEKKANKHRTHYEQYKRENIEIHKSLKRLFKPEKEDYFGSRSIQQQPQEIAKNEVKLSDFDRITKDQLLYFRQVSVSRELPNRKPTFVKTSFDLYKYLVNQFYIHHYDIDLIEKGFPFINDEQRKEYMLFKGDGVIDGIKYSWLSDEKLNKLRNNY